MRAGEKKKLLNESSLSKSQMRGNYSSSDYETVGIIEIRVKEKRKGGRWLAICSQWTADEEVAS